MSARKCLQLNNFENSPGDILNNSLEKGCHLCVRFLQNDSGATAIEYGLLAALLGVGIITGASGMGDTIQNLWGDVSADVAAP